MASQAYFRCNFNKQGAIKGEGITRERINWIPVHGFGFEIVSPRDLATGLPTGARQFRPIRFLKEWGAATPQLLAAIDHGESITTANFEFTRAAPNGGEYVYQTITLTLATVSDITQFMRPEADAAAGAALPVVGAAGREFEWISLTFQKIEVENRDGKTGFLADWGAVTG